MNDQPDIDRTLRAWFGDGPTEMPDRVLDVVADRIGRQPQRHAWRLQRRLPMNPIMKLAAALAAVVVVAVVGWSFLPRGSEGIGNPGATPTPTASSSPTSGPIATPCPTSAPGCIGPLLPGRHSTSQIITPFTYQVPDGWAKTHDVEGSVNLEVVAAPNGLLAVIPDWAVISQDLCNQDPDRDVGRTVDDIVTWLATHPGLTATAPETTSIGGLAGQTLEVEMVAGYAGVCSDGSVNLFTHQGTIGDGGWWNINDTMRLRLYILQAPNDHTVAVHVETGAKEDVDEFFQTATPVVESLDFTPG